MNRYQEMAKQGCFIFNTEEVAVFNHLYQLATTAGPDHNKPNIVLYSQLRPLLSPDTRQESWSDQLNIILHCIDRATWEMPGWEVAFSTLVVETVTKLPNQAYFRRIKERLPSISLSGKKQLGNFWHGEWERVFKIVNSQAQPKVHNVSSLKLVTGTKKATP